MDYQFKGESTSWLSGFLGFSKEVPKLYLFKIFLMGNCHSDQVSQPSQSFDHLAISQETLNGVKLMLKRFRICRQIVKMLEGSQNQLDGAAYTQNQAIDLAKTLIQGVVALEKPENFEQKQTVQDLFSLKNVELIRNWELSYFGILGLLNKQEKQISQNIKSRIYHKIANLKKEQLLQKQWKNEYNIDCIMDNSYKKLSEDQLDEVSRYEAISDHIQRMGEKIGFKLESIKKQSQKMVNLLSEVMAKNTVQINGLSYDLSHNEVMKMAVISRNACNYYDNGVFLLLAYFVQSCKRLQTQGIASEEIEKKLILAIENISSKYPPGEGLSKEHASLIATLKQLQTKKQQGKFIHKQIPLKSANKQAQVEQIIKDYAIIAEECKDLFQMLVKSTCLQRCVYFKIGLKYYPKNPNSKALTRIKEKMFFGKDSSSQKSMDGTIKEILRRQQTNYKKIIDDLLGEATNVSFKISDMVRGKCVFLEVSDIIETVKSIKTFAAKDSRFTIQEIQSRFTNDTPISDVTMKIVINNQIVAQLQLTIQTNAATYNFAHKIYELQRTKVFSKLKITHNYFEESGSEFNQLAIKALSLLASKSFISQPNTECIEQYFKLDSVHAKSFITVLAETFQEKKSELPCLEVVVDPLLQDLMMGIFCMTIGVWHKPLGKIINPALKNKKLSPKLKSVLVSYLLDKFQLSKESEYMQQLGMQYASQDELTSKTYMESFIKDFFQIQKIFEYETQNQKLFHRAYQLKQIQFILENYSQSIQLQESLFVMNEVIQQHSVQNIQRVIEMLNFYFVTRTEYNSFHDHFSCYYYWINSVIEQAKIDDKDLLRSQISIIKAQQLLETSKLQQAQLMLNNALQVFKSREEQGKVIECDILLTQCFIKASKCKLEESLKEYNLKIVRKAETLGLLLKGDLFADAMWRVSEALWNQSNEDEKKCLLESFTTIALKQMSRIKGKQLIYALGEKWKQYGPRGAQQCEILENPKITYVKLHSLNASGCQHLSLAKWKNLIQLNLNKNDIGATGCKFLSKANWQNLTQLHLNYGNIGPIGCEHLSIADWKKLTLLDLSNCDIGPTGCEHLSKAKWENLTHLNLNSNNVGAIGCENLSRSHWKNLTKLDLNYNEIGAIGCLHLSQAKWENLTQIDLNYNSIEDAGCEHLSNAKWKNLTHLLLYGNKIKTAGSKHLSKANWENLTQLHLYDNYIGGDGCEYLSKASWEKLTRLNLYSNGIGDYGCKYLSKASWQNLTILYLFRNGIGDRGCQYLSNASWEKLSQLNLDSNQIGNNGFDSLSKASWKNLTCLNLRNNKMNNNQQARAKFTQESLEIQF